MKRLVLMLLTISLVYFSSCESMLETGLDHEMNKISENFLFETTHVVNLDLSLTNYEGVSEKNVNFYIYKGNDRIGGGRTDSKGNYSTKLVLPTYVETLKIRTDHPEYQGSVNVDIDFNTIQLNLYNDLNNVFTLEQPNPMAKKTSPENSVDDSMILQGYEFVFNGVADNGDGTYTWAYTVTGVAEDDNNIKDLSHWVIGLCDEHTVSSVSPDYDWEVGTDPKTGLYGLKWDHSVDKDGGAKSFSFDLDEDYEIGSVDVALKAGPSSYYSIINGPSCTADVPDTSFSNITDGFLAYEDMWPIKGNYDFNDLVVDYTINQITNADNKITQIQIDLEVIAAGAKYNNAFGFEIDGLSPADVSSVEGDFRHETNIASTGESINGNFVIIPFDNTQQLFNSETFYINTKHYPPSDPQELSYTINLSPPVPITEFDEPPYNPFIIINSILNGNEVHLMGRPSTFIETTQDKPYQDEIGMPWAIHIAEDFDYPTEEIDIRDVYLHFEEWAESGGELYKDWYKNRNGYRDSELTYTQED